MGAMTESDAYISGVAAGWDHANHSLNVESREATIDDADDADVFAGYDPLEYRTGYAEGIERYNNDQWQDGTPMDEES